MKPPNRTYDNVYEQTPDFFGAQHEKMLEDYVHLIGKVHPVLDVGMGQGRNVLFLARRGFTVHGFDPSWVAVQTVTSQAKLEELSIVATRSDFQSYGPQAPCYCAVLLFGLIQMLPWEAIEALLDRARRWTEEGGLVFVTAFSREDTSYGVHVRESKALGRNSFRTSGGEIRTFLEPGEILNLFAGFSVIHRWEGLGPVHRHGEGSEERHARIEGVFQKPLSITPKNPFGNPSGDSSS